MFHLPAPAAFWNVYQMVQLVAAIIITQVMGWQQWSIVGIGALLPPEEGGG